MEQVDEINNLKNDLKNSQEDNSFLKNEKSLLEKKLINEINENKEHKEKERKFEERSMQYYLSLEENKKVLVINKNMNIYIYIFKKYCFILFFIQRLKIDINVYNYLIVKYQGERIQ